MEKFLHATFAVCRRNGEWFDLKEREITYLQNLWMCYFQEVSICHPPIFSYSYTALCMGVNEIMEFDTSCFEYEKKQIARYDKKVKVKNLNNNSGGVK
jgi:hypothetical protein